MLWWTLKLARVPSKDPSVRLADDVTYYRTDPRLIGSVLEGVRRSLASGKYESIALMGPDGKEQPWEQT